MPMEWKNLSPLPKLLVLRCLRPDRLTAALESFISANMGSKYIKDQAVDLTVSFQDSSPTTPVFFILSPGVNPLLDTEALGRKLGYTEDAGLFHYVSLGQGQEPVAEKALEACFQRGGWVFLSNIHLTRKWLPMLEKILDMYSEGFNRQ
eukprot:RCo039584